MKPGIWLKVIFSSLIFYYATQSLGQSATPTPDMPTPVPSPGPTPMTTPRPSPTPMDTGFQAIIKQIDSDKNKAVAETSGDSPNFSVGSQLVALQDGHNCFFQVMSINGKLAQLDILHCPFIEKIRVGELLEPSLFVDPPPQSTPQWATPTRFTKDSSDRDNRIRLAIAPYYGLGDSLSSDNLYYNQVGQPTTYGSGNLTMNTAPGVAVEIYETPKNGFGWSSGLSYDFQRSVSGLNAYANGAFIGGSFYSPEPTLSILTIYANAVYRMEDFYFPFGLNYCIPSLQGGGNAFGNTVLTGNVGLQIAAGYILTDNLAIEFWMQNLFLDGSTGNSSGSIEYNGLTFINPQLRLRLSF